MLKQLNEQFEFLQDVPVSPADFRGRETSEAAGGVNDSDDVDAECESDSEAEADELDGGEKRRGLNEVKWLNLASFRVEGLRETKLLFPIEWDARRFDGLKLRD